LAEAAPAYFPYSHRTLDGGDGSHLLQQYEQCQSAFNNGAKNWRVFKRGRKVSGEQIRDETFAEPAVCDKEMADREGAANACLSPDLTTSCSEATG